MRATLKRPARIESHVACIEQPHRLVLDDVELVGGKIPAPPGRMEEPSLRDDIAALAMSPLTERSEQDVALGVNCVIRVAWPVTTSNSLRNVYFIRPISLFALTPWVAQVPDQSFMAEFARGQAVAKSLKARFDL